MKQLVTHMSQQMRIVFRGDSGYFVGELLEWLDAKRHGYLIKVKLKGLTSLLDQQSWQAIDKAPGWQQCEFIHQCGTWSRGRRFVAVRRLKKEKTIVFRNNCLQSLFMTIFAMSQRSVLLSGKPISVMEKELLAKHG